MKQLPKTYDQLFNELYEIIAYRNLKPAYAILAKQFPRKKTIAALNIQELEAIIPLIREEYAIKKYIK